jgi:oligoendopeptidase F
LFIQDSDKSKRNRGHGSQGAVWNLEELYRGTHDKGIEKDLKTAYEKALAFVASYKGRLHRKPLKTEFLLSALCDYESIHEIAMKPTLFAFLYHSSDTADHGGIALLKKVEEKWSEISQMLTFFELQLMALPKGLLMELADHPDLSPYRHFLLHQVEWKGFALSETAEKVIKRKNLSGRRAFESLYDEIMGSLSFSLEMDGEYRDIDAGRAIALLQSNKPVTREKAFHGFLEALQRHGTVFKSILNALILDFHLENEERGHPTPMHRTYLLNEIDGSLVEGMMEAVESHYPMVQRYFQLKAKLLGVKVITYTDIFAPLMKKPTSIDFRKAEELLMGAMENLHPLFSSIASEFFEKNRVNWKMRKGKEKGSFCKCLAPSQKPYISLAYGGTFRDVMELAHEIGHGIHYVLSSKQSYLNFRMVPIVAETVAIFFEIVQCHYLMKREDFNMHGQAILACAIERMISTVYRQNVLARFEKALYDLRKDHPVNEEEICQLWWDENKKLYGASVEIVPAYRWGWAYIPHLVHLPFYCWSYIFGNLVSIILFENFVEQGDRFMKRIIRLFSSGSSAAPLEMLNEIGFDHRDDSLWDRSFQYMAGLIDCLETYKRNDDHTFPFQDI